ncbi:antitoxin [Saccharopolyspora sp. CA-218241]|uniref:antitoxin n=1 Tax=Saccharopolyspora sp. CA-218241 TaxID=3240027 RepID=UPI003D96AA29
MKLKDLKDKLTHLGRQHPEQAEQGVDRAAGAAKERFGHGEQIDKAAEKGKEQFRGPDAPPQQRGEGGQPPPEGGPPPR